MSGKSRRKYFFDENLLKKYSKIIKETIPQNMEFDAKGVPKWSQHRCQNSSKINANTGNGTTAENQKNTFL